MIMILLFSQLSSIRQRRKMNRNEVLSFLFRLGCLQLGKVVQVFYQLSLCEVFISNSQGYLVRLLTKSQRVVVDDLVQFGLIYHYRR